MPDFAFPLQALFESFPLFVGVPGRFEIGLDETKSLYFQPVPFLDKLTCLPFAESLPQLKKATVGVTVALITH